MARSGINAQLTPLKKKIKIQSGQTKKYAKQGYCSECGIKTRWNCSQCLDRKDDPDAKDVDVSYIDWEKLLYLPYEILPYNIDEDIYQCQLSDIDIIDTRPCRNIIINLIKIDILPIEPKQVILDQ